MCGEIKMKIHTFVRRNISIAVFLCSISLLVFAGCAKEEAKPIIKTAAQQASDYEMAGDYDRALSAYDEAIAQKPGYEDLWEAKADILFKQAKYQEALDAFDRVLQLGPYFAGTIWLKKGDTLYGMTKYEDSLDAYDESLLRADYESAIKGKAWIGKTKAYIKLGRLSEAEKSLTKVSYIFGELQDSLDNARDR